MKKLIVGFVVLVVVGVGFFFLRNKTSDTSTQEISTPGEVSSGQVKDILQTIPELQTTGFIVPDQDSLVSLTGKYQRDKKHYFYEGEYLSGVMGSGFSLMDTFFPKQHLKVDIVSTNSSMYAVFVVRYYNALQKLYVQELPFDAESFSVLLPKKILRDKTGVYTYDVISGSFSYEKLQGVNHNAFNVFTGYWFSDGNSLYCQSFLVSDHLSELNILDSSSLILDGKLYSCGSYSLSSMENLDTTGVVLISQDIDLFTDGNVLYTWLTGSEIETYENLGVGISSWSYDASQNIITGFDVSSLEPMALYGRGINGIWKDKKGIYFDGKLLKGIDPNEFVVKSVWFGTGFTEGSYVFVGHDSDTSYVFTRLPYFGSSFSFLTGAQILSGSDIRYEGGYLIVDDNVYFARDDMDSPPYTNQVVSIYSSGSNFISRYSDSGLNRTDIEDFYEFPYNFGYWSAKDENYFFGEGEIVGVISGSDVISVDDFVSIKSINDGDGGKKLDIEIHEPLRSFAENVSVTSCDVSSLYNTYDEPFFLQNNSFPTYSYHIAEKRNNVCTLPYYITLYDKDMRIITIVERPEKR